MFTLVVEVFNQVERFQDPFQIWSFHGNLLVPAFVVVLVSSEVDAQNSGLILDGLDSVLPLAEDFDDSRGVDYVSHDAATRVARSYGAGLVKSVLITRSGEQSDELNEESSI